MTPDMVNGLFEVVGGVLLIQNVLAIAKDKKYRGVRILPTVFFALWGLWNLYYYPYLDQMYSFLGGLFLFGSNLVWIILMVKYRNN